MSYELLYGATADEALARLEGDPEKAAALRAVDRTLVRLSDDPFNPRLGTTAFMTDPIGGVNATPARYDDWYVIWQCGGQSTIVIVAIHQVRL